MRDDMSDNELGQKILQVSGFAGVYPEHKHRIVQALQARGMLVGMTGMPILARCVEGRRSPNSKLYTSLPSSRHLQKGLMFHSQCRGWSK